MKFDPKVAMKEYEKLSPVQLDERFAAPKPEPEPVEPTLKESLLELLKEHLTIELRTDTGYDYGDGDTKYLRVKVRALFNEVLIAETDDSVFTALINYGIGK
jgi:hypothetical protein